MKRISLRAGLLLGLLGAQFSLFAQDGNHSQKQYESKIVYKSQVDPNGFVRCHTMEMDSVRRMNNPHLPSLAQEEAWLQKEIAKYTANPANQNKKVVLTIPIIFHIITDGAGTENISATYVNAQIDQLNLDYANMSGSSYAVAADCEIQFCAALKDPNGTPLAEAGIERVTTYGDGPFSDTYVDGTIKPGTSWDPNNYFNVWVADLSGGLLGWAQFPSSSGLSGMPSNGGAANTDGVVVLYSSVGSVATPFPGGSPYNLGRTLTHEAGHWLGLRHIWGDGGCSVDDFCNDTPKSDAANFNCPNTNSCTDSYGSPWPTANPVDMVENYMDYTNDNCMNTFTGDQKTRMQTVMSVSPRRLSLASSTACTLSSNPDNIGVSSITSPTGSYCATSFVPSVVVSNYGSNAVSSFTLSYNVDGTGTQTYNWTGTLGVGSTTTVTLSSMSSSAGNHVFNAFTTVPNGNTDTDPSNDANSSNFSLSTGGNIVTLTLSTDCWGEETAWEVLNASNSQVATGGNQNITFPVTSQQATNTTDPGAYGSQITITEELCLANGCYDFIIYDAFGDGMNGVASNCPVNGSYTIKDANNNILGSLQAANADFGFSETSSFCVPFDNSGINELANNNFLIYPNPSEGIFYVELLDQVAEQFTVSVMDITGRVIRVEQHNNSKFVVDLSDVATGNYTINIETLNHKMMKRVIVK